MYERGVVPYEQNNQILNRKHYYATENDTLANGSAEHDTLPIHSWSSWALMAI